MAMSAPMVHTANRHRPGPATKVVERLPSSGSRSTGSVERLRRAAPVRTPPSNASVERLRESPARQARVCRRLPLMSLAMLNMIPWAAVRTAGNGVSVSEPEAVVEASRRDLYRYVTAENSREYFAIMRLFTQTLLTDLSASETAALLTESGIVLSVDDVEARCRQLEEWGNLVRSVRDARVATVAEWLRSRSRYQVSKLGGRVHRQVEEVLRASDGVREVARELLGRTVDTLDRILDRLTSAPIDADALAGDVTTVFNNQRLFTESARDFYAYLHQVLSRYDLAGAEYASFKTLLLQYVDLITADVTRHAPAIADRLDRILQQLPTLLETVATLPTLTGPDGTPAERSPGRTSGTYEPPRRPRGGTLTPSTCRCRCASAATARPAVVRRGCPTRPWTGRSCSPRRRRRPIATGLPRPSSSPPGRWTVPACPRPPATYCSTGSPTCSPSL